MADLETGRPKRLGARRLSDVPPAVRRALETGDTESANLMEWLVADMAALARTVSSEVRDAGLTTALQEAAEKLPGMSITERLKLVGDLIAESGAVGRSAVFEKLANHRSDIVRQWACYAVNSERLKPKKIAADRLLRQTVSLESRLNATMRFAGDRNMTVREAAWMAARPHVANALGPALKVLRDFSTHSDSNIRRFAIEVTRPRSVWRLHIVPLKRDPSQARELLNDVKSDPSRYVQLAVGNWLNDASKSRPDWVMQVCSEWMESPTTETRNIVKRGLRTIVRSLSAGCGDLFASALPLSLRPV
jgi:3-methyladenine DNA glycosylase AlkC